jgi:Kef-type K+ transport system membrane component KefB
MELSIELQLSILLLTALAGYILSSKINQSAVVGEILIGIIIGPSLLGLITYSDFIKIFAQLGAIILLFSIGLEFKLKDIFNIKYGIIAFIGVIIPWVGGFFVAEFFGYDFISSFFVGTALTATSVAITANVLKEMGKLQTEAAKAIMGAAVIDDILGLIALSLSVQMKTGSITFFPILLVLIKVIVFIVLGALVGRLILKRVVEKLDTTKLADKFSETVFIFIVMIAFFYAALAELSGLSVIVGAFLAGAAFEGLIIRKGRNCKIGTDYLQMIFAPVFFVSLGILANFKEITVSIVWFIIVLTIVAILTKLIGCYLGARIGKLQHKDSLIVGIGMTPRGEVAMIVALIGLNLGVVTQDIYISVILMSLITTLIAPILLKNIKWNGNSKTPG